MLKEWVIFKPLNVPFFPSIIQGDSNCFSSCSSLRLDYGKFLFDYEIIVDKLPCYLAVQIALTVALIWGVVGRWVGELRKLTTAAPFGQSYFYYSMFIKNIYDIYFLSLLFILLLSLLGYSEKWTKNNTQTHTTLINNNAI